VISLTDERLRQLAYDDMVCTNANERAMAAELLSARARIAELEAAQRPPLGYVVLSRNPDGGRLHPQGSVHPTREPAEEWRQWLEAHGRQFLVAEVREVQS
jgi:hypothetical protein